VKDPLILFYIPPVRYKYSINEGTHMARNKTPEKKETLVKAQRTAKKAPIWVFARTGRTVRGSPKSGRNWKRSSIF
jgi:ribosomal protein L39E